MRVSFSASKLFPDDSGCWLHGQVDGFGDGPDAWVGAATAVGDRPVRCILAVIRNAVAHGNFYTKGNPIDQLVLYAEERRNQRVIGYEYLVIPVAAFRRFLFAWFDHISALGIPYSDALRAVAKAA